MMNAYELECIEKSQAVITKLAVDAKKVGLSYGQLQAQKYEQQLKLEKLQKRLEEEQQQQAPTKTSRAGRPKKQRPESFPEIAEIMLSGNLSVNQASIMLHVSRGTVYKWLDEYVSNSKSCRK